MTKIAYIDSQNIKLGIRENGRDVDWNKLFQYLKKRYAIDIIKFFVWYIASNQVQYDELQKIGYVVCFKQTYCNEEWKTKWNIDTLLMKHAMRDLDTITGAYLLSWDGDFDVIIHVRRKQWVFKKLFLPNSRKISQLLLKSTKIAERNFLFELQSKISIQENVVWNQSYNASGRPLPLKWANVLYPNDTITIRKKNQKARDFGSKTKPIIVITSGYFNPLHPWHIECFEMCKALWDELRVIINSDEQARRKTGQNTLFQDQEYRMSIVSALKTVDRVMLAVDIDWSVCESIKTIVWLIHAEYGDDIHIVFGKGGDRFVGNIPEV